MKKSEKLGYCAIVVLGFVVRISGLQNTADFHTINAWRESDYTEIARSYYRGETSFFFPHVDWRGNSSGAVEMEFPILPWVAAKIYSIVGYHEQVLRVLSSLFGVLGLVAFAQLARKILPGAAGVFATACFACNGLLVETAGSIQPESLQIGLSIVAMVYIWRWSESGKRRELLVGCAWIAAAVLVKAPSVLLGFVVAYFAFRREGWKALTDPVIYVGAATALFPPIVWYSWAHHLFFTTGLSLGLSNETHFLSWVLVAHPYSWLRGNVSVEIVEVYTIGGVILVATALLQHWKTIEFAAIWYLSVLIFYVIIADTSGDGWAAYYHCNSVPAACLLMGSGLSWIISSTHRFSFLRTKVWIARVVSFGFGGVVLVSLGTRAHHYIEIVDDRQDLREMYDCMKAFQRYVPTDESIIVRGGRKYDEHGHPVAYNESMAFTWMDRKGQNYPADDFSIQTILRLRNSGGSFWVASPADQMNAAEMEKAKSQFELVSSCGSYQLYHVPNETGT